MTAFLSPFFGAGAQLFTSQGVVLSGGKINTYIAGSATPQATWTDSTQATPNGNPITLDTAGRPPQEIWLQSGVAYKFVVTNSVGGDSRSFDNITGINDTASASLSQWQATGLTPSYISTTQFSIAGDQTATFQIGRRLQISETAGTVYGIVTGSAFTTVTTITVQLDSGALDSGISQVNVGVLTPQNSSIPRIAMSARLSANQNCGSSAVAIFDEVFFDYGSGYNVTTGVYSVPVQGVYLISFAMVIQSGAASVDTIYVDAGAARTMSARTPAPATNTPLSGSFIAPFSVGDTIFITVSTTGATAATAIARAGGVTRSCNFSVTRLF